MSNPFDDPEFVAQMARMGVVHAPGTAAKMLEELSPLLQADGIDLDNLEGTDLDQVNAALARATERHNFELFTPIGVRRTGALRVLRRLSEAVASGQLARASVVLAAIQPEPDDDAPAISHVIGVSLGLLDEWHVDPTLRTALAGTRLPAWEKRSRAAATDVLALARKGRAFGTLDGLHRRHSGLAIFEGAALAVAASVAARAAFEGVAVGEVADRVFGAASGSAGSSGSAGASGASFRRPSVPAATAPTRPVSGVRARSAARPVQRLVPASDRAVLVKFERWLKKEASIGVVVSETRQMLEALFEMARSARLDLHDPADIDAIIDMVFDAQDAEDPDITDDALDALHDYVHFQLETSRDVAGWDEVHEIIEEALEDARPGSDAIARAIDISAQIPAAERREALAQTRIIAAVSELVAWIGTGRSVSPTGGIRRADIAEVAAMLGVSAVGVNKRPVAPDPSTIHALSMYDVPLLAAWWEALRGAEVIDVSATRVRSRGLAAEWSNGPLPPEEASEMVVGILLTSLLVSEREARGVPFTAHLIAGLLIAIDPEPNGDVEGEPPVDAGVSRVLLVLREAGIVAADGSVPVALRGAVARGLALSLAYLGQGD